MAGGERDFSGLTARWVMWLDVPREMRKHKSVAYKPITGKRDTQFGISKGSPAFLLDDPDGDWCCMKPASLIVDPSQAYQSLKDLGRRLTPPPGWTFRAVILDQDLVLTPDDGAARIIQGDLGNTYDRGEARTAATRREARRAGACRRRRRRAMRSGSKPAPGCLHGATAGDHDRRGPERRAAPGAEMAGRHDGRAPRRRRVTSDRLPGRSPAHPASRGARHAP
jgi:hypothetical protein